MHSKPLNTQFIWYDLIYSSNWTNINKYELGKLIKLVNKGLKLLKSYE